MQRDAACTWDAPLSPALHAEERGACYGRGGWRMLAWTEDLHDLVQIKTAELCQ